MKRRLTIAIMAAVALLAMPSCSDNEEIPSDPEETVTVNMLDTENGGTVLDYSGIRINSSQNFVSQGDWGLVEVGKVGGLGYISGRDVEFCSGEVAVTVGGGYIAYPVSDMRRFDSGKMALPIDGSTACMKLYVVSLLERDEKRVGASVKYAMLRPSTYGLPTFGSTVCKIDVFSSQKATITLPSAECEYYLDDDYDQIECRKSGNKLELTVKYLGGNDRLDLYLRMRDSYTKVVVELVSGYGY